MDDSEQIKRAIRFVATLWLIAFALSFPAAWVAAIILPENPAVLTAVFLAGQAVSLAPAVWALILTGQAERAGYTEVGFGRLPLAVQAIYWAFWIFDWLSGIL